MAELAAQERAQGVTLAQVAGRQDPRGVRPHQRDIRVVAGLQGALSGQPEAIGGEAADGADEGLERDLPPRASAAASSTSPLGKAATAYMDRGDLVPDQMVVDMVMERLGAARRPARRLPGRVPALQGAGPGGGRAPCGDARRGPPRAVPGCGDRGAGGPDRRPLALPELSGDLSEPLRQGAERGSLPGLQGRAVPASGRSSGGGAEADRGLPARDDAGHRPLCAPAIWWCGWTATARSSRSGRRSAPVWAASCGATAASHWHLYISDALHADVEGTRGTGGRCADATWTARHSTVRGDERDFHGHPCRHCFLELRPRQHPILELPPCRPRWSRSSRSGCDGRRRRPPGSSADGGRPRRSAMGTCQACDGVPSASRPCAGRDAERGQISGPRLPSPAHGG